MRPLFGNQEPLVRAPEKRAEYRVGTERDHEVVRDRHHMSGGCIEHIGRMTERANDRALSTRAHCGTRTLADGSIRHRRAKSNAEAIEGPKREQRYQANYEHAFKHDLPDTQDSYPENTSNFSIVSALRELRRVAGTGKGGYLRRKALKNTVSVASSLAMTDLPKAGAKDVLYILDASGYIYRAYHALPELSNSKGEVTHAVLGLSNMLLKLLREKKPAQFAVAMDSPGPSFRKERFEDYKKHRETPKDLPQQIVRCREVFEALRLPVFAQQGVEADDIIATLVLRARKNKQRVVIVSADKDLLQLVTDDVLMYDGMREKVYGPAEAEKKMLVPPGQVRDLLALTGDKSDNVPGVPSVGPKTAAKLLAEYETLEGIYDHVEEVSGKALKAKLQSHRDAAFLSQDLVTLKSDVELDDADLAPGAWNEEALHRLFEELGFSALIKRLGLRTGAGEGAPESNKPANAKRDGATTSYANRVVDSQLALLDWLSDIEGRELGVSIVAEDEDPLRGGAIGAALAKRDGERGECIYVPLAHRYLAAPDMLPTEAYPVFAALAKAKLRVHDTKGTCSFFSALGVDGRAVGEAVDFGLALASYLLDPGRRDHSISAIGAAYGKGALSKVPAFGSLISKKKGQAHGLESVEVDKLAPVAQSQAAAALELSDVLENELDEASLKLLREVELPLAVVLSKLERTGIRLDVPFLREMSETFSAKLSDLEAHACELAGHEFNVNSPRQLETILFDELELPVVKKTKTARSTDHEVLEELATLHELPSTILQYRMLAKLKSTYVDALPEVVNKRTGRIHASFNQTVAATGRLSSSDPNLQNIPIRTEEGRRIRGAFIPQEGWQLLAADYSQIELRILAHLSADEELCDAYNKSDDVHVRTATALFDVDAKDVDRTMRGQAKTVNFAVIYGQTQFALARNLGISRAEASRYIAAFFKKYAGVKAYMDKTIEDAKKNGYVTTMFGRRRPIPELRSKNHNIRAGGERMAGNTPIQGSAADLIKKAMIDIDQKLCDEKLEARMLLTVHDELVFEVPPGEESLVGPLVQETMQSAIKLDVPLVVELGWGKNWEEAH